MTGATAAVWRHHAHVTPCVAFAIGPLAAVQDQLVRFAAGRCSAALSNCTPGPRWRSAHKWPFQTSRSVRCGPRERHRSLVERIWTPLALGVAAFLLLADPGLLGASGRLRCPPALLDDECSIHQLDQPCFSGLAVLQLAATRTGNDANGSPSIDSGREPGFHQASICFVQRGGRPHIPRQLDPRGRRVDMLSAGPAGPASFVVQLAQRYCSAAGKLQTDLSPHS